MKITVKIGILISIVWMLSKFIFHVLVPQTSDLTPMIFINMFLLLSAVSIGLYFHKKNEGFSQGTVMSDIKGGMTSGVIYALFVSIFVYFYYSKINPDFNKHQISEAKMAIRDRLDDPKGLAQIKQAQPAYEVMTKEQIYKEMVKGPQSFFAPGSTFVLTLLSLVLLSTIYSILVTVIFRKILFRRI